MVSRVASLLALVLSLLAASASPAAANSKYAAIVVHADSGDVLFSRYADKQLYPASLTKMMTLYLLFEEIEAGRLSLDSKLKVSSRAAGQPPSKLGVKAGTTIDVETAIKALVVKSANDVAVVVAEAISGSEWQFARKMTAKARSMGMRRTSFRNASGLPNRRQLTTARDLTILSRRVVQDFPELYPLFASKTFTWNNRTYRTHNRLVKDYPGADGLKTGYTRRSGFNLATTAVRDGERLIGVVLGGRSGRTRDAHMRKILTASFSRLKEKPTLVAALHRDTPTPALKPGTQAPAALLAAAIPAPTLADKAALAGRIETAAAAFGAADGEDVAGAFVSDDAISALIAAADVVDPMALSPDEAEAVIDDLNEFEQFRLAAADFNEALGQGDRDASALDKWDVQIGAFRSKQLAQSELEATATEMEMVATARMVTPMAGPGGDTYYRARFVALPETDARAACERMKAAKRACIVVNDHDVDAQ